MIYEQCKDKIELRITELNGILKNFPSVEGNICTTKDMIWKRKNICNLASRCNLVLEIGFNAGHSAIHFLESNPNLHLYCFDIGYHLYTDPCYQYLSKIYGDRIHMKYGNSTVTIPKFFKKNPDLKFDMYHIDGCHLTDVALQDLNNCYEHARMCNQPLDKPSNPKLGTHFFIKQELYDVNSWKEWYKRPWVIFDDIDMPELNSLWYDFCGKNKIWEVDLYDYNLFPTLNFKHGIGMFTQDTHMVDVEWYRSYYTDLYGLRTPEQVYSHWKTYGCKEGRFPNAYLLSLYKNDH